MAATSTGKNSALRKSAGFLQTFIRRPQRTFLRKAMFQIHLWAGIALSLYVVLIGLSGSITVFQMDLGMDVPRELQARPLDPSHYRSLDDIHAALLRANPKARVMSILAPDEDRHAFGGLMFAKGERYLGTVDPYSGKVLHMASMSRHWAFAIGEFHENMFLGRTGEVISGIASFILLAILFTGVVIWWPGIARWTRALTVNFRANWKRVNFDLHSAVGFWTLLLCAMWCVTTIVMVWPEASTRVVSYVSPITDAVENPKVPLPKHTGACPAFTMQGVADAAKAAQPSTRLAAYVPGPPRQPIRVYMARGTILNRAEWDEQRFDPCTGKLLFVWKRWIWKSPGDVLIGISRPLHAGFVWGRWAQWTWFAFGLAFPVLTVTGLLMYWNRYLGKKWRALQFPRAKTAEVSASYK